MRTLPLRPVLAAYSGSAWIDWSWVHDHVDEILQRTREHVVLTLLAVGLGLLLAVPLALLAARWRVLLGPVLGVTAVLYTIPSLAAFALLLPFTGLGRATAVVPLASYTLLILVRNIVAALDGVPAEVKEAASGMGYTAGRRLLRVELPLALPAIIAGLRIAVVTIIGLIPVAALVGQGGLGTLMLDGFQRAFRTPLVVGSIITILLAVVADLLLLGVQRLLTPWSRAAGTPAAAR